MHLSYGEDESLLSKRGIKIYFFCILSQQILSIWVWLEV